MATHPLTAHRGYPPPIPRDVASVAEERDGDTPSPWLSIWVRPRATIRRIVREDAHRHVLLLAGLAGIGEALDRASFRNLGDRVGLPVIVTGALLIGPLAGMASVYFGAFMVRLSGGWLGGRATSEALRAAIAWGSVPVVLVGLPIWALELAIYGQDMFTEATPTIEGSPALLLLLLALLGVEMIVAIWGLVLTLKGIGEVHGFSAWRALGAVALAAAIVIGPILFIVLLGLAAVVAMR